jgi:hypothetical protein
MATKKTTKKSNSPLSIIKSAAKNLVNKAVSTVKKLVTPKIAEAPSPKVTNKFNTGYQVSLREPTVSTKTKTPTPLQIITGKKPEAVLSGRGTPGAGAVFTGNGTIQEAPKTKVGSILKQPLLSSPKGGGGSFGGGTTGGGATTPTVNPMLKAFTTSGIEPVADGSRYSSMISGLSSNFGGTTAPTNVNSLSLGTAKPRIPTLPYETPDVTQPRADLEASKAYNDLQLKDEQQQDQSEQERLALENRSILEKIMGNQPEPMEVRRDYEKYYQVAAQQAKLESLNKDYNNLVAQRDAQIAQESSRFGLQDFTNNRINQIYDNSAPRINQLAADIKFETAQLTQRQELVSQAVDDYFRDWDRKMDLYEMYMEQNEDLISRLDKKEQDAIDRAFDLKKMELQEAKEIRTMIAREAFANPTAGIDPWSDTPEQVMQKLARVEAESGAGGWSGKYDTYFIRAGEDLRVIADKFGLPYETIQAANPTLNEYNIPVGQAIKIPTESAEIGDGTGELSKTDYNKGLNYVLLNGTEEDVMAYKTDRAYQAQILSELE